MQIKSKEQLENALISVPQKQREAVAIRMALRFLPNISQFGSLKVSIQNDFGSILLVYLRQTLAAGVAHQFVGHDFREIESRALRHSTHMKEILFAANGPKLKVQGKWSPSVDDAFIRCLRFLFPTVMARTLEYAVGASEIAIVLSTHNDVLEKWSIDKLQQAIMNLTNAELSAALSDLALEGVVPLEQRLWPDPSELRPSVFSDAGSVWSFWREWYQGFLDGKPMDWELQRRVAMIEDPIWEAGPEAVAKEIERIRAEFNRERAAVDGRQKEFEPDSVERLFANRVISISSASQVVVEISEAIERFHSETGCNQIPETFAPLQAMPRSLARIGYILKHEERTSKTEQKLREEIGRLNAKVAKLEAELEVARSSKEPIFAPAFKKQLGATLGGWQLYTALCGSLWIISGDELGPQKRLENILEYRDFLFGDVSPQPDMEKLERISPITEV